jgi:hypothetical protein
MMSQKAHIIPKKSTIEMKFDQPVREEEEESITSEEEESKVIKTKNHH